MEDTCYVLNRMSFRSFFIDLRTEKIVVSPEFGCRSDKMCIFVKTIFLKHQKQHGHEILS